MVLSAPAAPSARKMYIGAWTCRHLLTLGTTTNEVNLTELGVAHATGLLKLTDREGGHEFWTGKMWGRYVQQALNALIFKVRDVDYTIGIGRKGRKQTILLDKQTGAL